MRDRKTARAATGAALAVALAGGVVFGVAQGDPAPPPTVIEPDGQPRKAAVDPAEAAAFTILRRPQHAGDALPGRPSGPFGANLDLARGADTPLGSIRVVPASGGQLCLRVQTASKLAWTCTSVKFAAQGRLVLTFRGVDRGGPAEIFGLVPDGAREVRIASARGETAHPVTDNLYAATADGPRSISFTDASGSAWAVEP
jgi:hypothetical protein